MSVLLLQMKQDELEHLEALVTDFLEISPREQSDNMPFFMTEVELQSMVYSCKVF